MRKGTGLLAAVALLASLLLSTLVGSSAGATVVGTNVDYTTDADFDQGTLVNVNHDAPNSNQLQLNTASGTFPFVWVALSQRCTIAKVNTATGAILGEYRTVADGAGCNESSRTTVAIDGSVWVGHRGPGGVNHVGLAELNQCVDRNGNGTIETSSGYGNVLPWPGAVSTVANAADECILHHVDTNALGLQDSRHMSIDAANKLWVGDYVGGSKFVRINGSTGAVESSVFDLPCGGYGGLIDGNGVIWSANGSNPGLLRWDPAAAMSASNPRCLNSISPYGLAVDKNGFIWVSALFGNRVWKVSADGNTILGPFGHGADSAQGLAVTPDGDVWVSSSLFCNSGCTVGHLKNDGTFVGNVPTPTGIGSTGVSIDADGMVWVAHRNSHTATRIDPNAGPIGGGGDTVGAVNLTVSFPATAGRPVPFPYNYSDMTGAQLFSSTAPQGSWTVTQDAGSAGADWGDITWNTEDEGDEPAGTAIVVDVRTADTEAGLGSASYVPVANGGAIASTGRFLQVRVTLKAAPDGTSPVLSDLHVTGGNEAPTVDAGGPYDGDEGSAIPVNGSADDADGDAVTTSWSATPGAGTDPGASCTFDDPSAVATNVTCTDDGEYTLTLTADDGVAEPVSSDATLTVANVAPTIEITSPADGALFAIGQPVNVTASIADAGSNDTHTCSASWDDGTSSDGSVSSGSCTASRTYSGAGVYTIVVTTTDDDGASASDSVMVVVYDPSAGFVTGGGTIQVREGSYPADPTLSGRANFGFVSKYKRGATTPTGQTEFQFQVADLNFHSDTYQWLVVSGPKAQFKGTGTVNGASGYSFLLTATDGQVNGGGGVDKFRIKIWDANDAIVFDNVMGASSDVDSANPQAIATGSIVIHK